MDNYEKIYREFRWNTPEYFNFGNVIDEFSSDHNRVALLWEDQEGNRARMTFGDFKEQSNRIANVLKELGIQPGDPILLVLPRIPIWQAAYIGALKVGAIVVPCTAMLREKDLVYRANHSGAKAIIASVDSANDGGRPAQSVPYPRALPHRRRAAQRMEKSSRRDEESLGEIRRREDSRQRSRDLLLHLGHDQGTEGRAACAWLYL